MVMQAMCCHESDMLVILRGYKGHASDELVMQMMPREYKRGVDHASDASRIQAMCWLCKPCVVDTCDVLVMQVKRRGYKRCVGHTSDASGIIQAVVVQAMC
ncbi:hypothetical protein ElyMa_006129600 [Elysia marginata]|uniref:DDE Tnp4 domain-containing protein n=1 Tax=Elysia marginata TaxID=1093978 RepID=A0AAV4GWG6_9GAST|nr:hypothetical protein ElyMa_006129600 [Elysia marginata]